MRIFGISFDHLTLDGKPRVGMKSGREYSEVALADLLGRLIEENNALESRLTTLESRISALESLTPRPVGPPPVDVTKTLEYQNQARPEFVESLLERLKDDHDRDA